MAAMIDWTIPIILVSPNIQEHWTNRHKRNKRIFSLISRKWVFEKAKVSLPCTITLIRLAPREYDYDNLVFAFKGVRDTIASLIIPGQAPGRADADPRITWVYKQEKAKTKGIRIQIANL